MISDSILHTLTYSDHFGFPLTLSELHSRLININTLAKDRSELQRQFGSLSGLQQVLNKLISAHKIEKTGDYYHLLGHSNLVAHRENNRQTSLPVFSKAKHLAIKLSKVPGVLSIYLTGSLAMFNSTPDSDIDFMVITKNNRLWTTRFLLTIYTTILGLRRTPSSRNYSSKLCLNLYLTPYSYELPPIKRSLYTAYELIQAVPLYDPSSTHPQLLAANSWIKKYLSNLVVANCSTLPAQKYSKTGILENLLYQLQLLYMRPRLTRELITRDSAFFHPNNPGDKLLKKVQGIIG